ncbi:DUF1002 domain-containing protein [Anaerophilus nitritogenes]|uniref:DUF1002 domain-containing protein n=1 Tax=Anaerophilus nitritogenes TaxID=2498136 RepID=UPI0013EAE4B7|nr:DUF1002 domain-containing protein [Anaerophilus nitritogenes]
MKKKFVLLWMILFLMTSVSYADSFKVVTLGADLTQEQQNTMLKEFGIEDGDGQIIYVTNEEERQYLKDIVSLSKIGNRSISCAYVKPLEEGLGIKVSIANLTWVTEEMIANSLTTAGIKDVEVKASAPFKVSGTAALTGIMKGFEKATGKELSQDAKNAANKEIITTGELGDQFGKDKAVDLMQQVKKEVISNNVKTPDDIRTIIQKVAKHNDVNLSEEQIQKIIDVMNQISKLDLNMKEISNQLKDIRGKLSQVISQNEEAKSLLAKILDMLQGIMNKIKNWI